MSGMKLLSQEIDRQSRRIDRQPNSGWSNISQAMSEVVRDEWFHHSNIRAWDKSTTHKV